MDPVASLIRRPGSPLPARPRPRWCRSGLQFIFQHFAPPFLTRFLSLSRRLFPLPAESLATQQTSVGVEKLSHTHLPAWNPVIPFRLWRRTSQKEGTYVGRRDF